MAGQRGGVGAFYPSTRAPDFAQTSIGSLPADPTRRTPLIR
jgi:hypothetical protein